MQHAEWKLKLMAYLDGELSAEERAAFEREIEASAEIREELEELKRVKDMTTRIAFVDLEDADWTRYWRGIYNRTEQAAGWILLSLGTVILTVYGLYHFLQALWRDTTTPLLVRFGEFALVAGLAILLVSVLRHRLHSGKNDPYRGVRR